MCAAMPSLLGRLLLATVMVDGICAYSGAQDTVAPQVADLSSVFADKVTIPREVEGQAGTLVWKGKNFPLEDTPRFRRAQPIAGDFALYRVLHSHRNVLGGLARIQGLGEYLMLEYVRPKRDYSPVEKDIVWLNESTVTSVRLYGVARHPQYSDDIRWPVIGFRGLVTDAAGGSYPFQMPPREMESFKDESISLADLTYFRDYKKFAAETNEKSGNGRNDRVSWSKLQDHPTLGQLWRFKWDYFEMNDPAGGIETLCISEKVPVRGLVFAKDEWSSSSGVRNHIHAIQLLNFGRLSAAQVRAMETAEDALPEKVGLWKQMSEKHRPKAK